MSIDYTLIGGRIRSRRTAAHMTQEQLAEKLGVSVGYVGQMERDLTKPSLEMLSKLSAVFNCEVSFFLDGSVIEKDDYLEAELHRKFSRLDKKQRRLVIGFIDLISDYNKGPPEP